LGEGEPDEGQLAKVGCTQVLYLTRQENAVKFWNGTVNQHTYYVAKC